MKAEKHLRGCAFWEMGGVCGVKTENRQVFINFQAVGNVSSKKKKKKLHVSLSAKARAVCNVQRLETHRDYIIHPTESAGQFTGMDVFM